MQTPPIPPPLPPLNAGANTPTQKFLTKLDEQVLSVRDASKVLHHDLMNLHEKLYASLDDSPEYERLKKEEQKLKKEQEEQPKPTKT